MGRTVKASPELEFTFGEYVDEPKENPYAGHIDALAKRVKETGNENASLTVTPDVADAQSVKIKIQKAANDAGFTAKIRVFDESAVETVGTDDDGEPIREGKVTITFTLGKRHKARNRGPRKPVEEAAE